MHIPDDIFPLLANHLNTSDDSHEFEFIFTPKFSGKTLSLLINGNNCLILVGVRRLSPNDILGFHGHVD